MKKDCEPHKKEITQLLFEASSENQKNFEEEKQDLEQVIIQVIF